MQRRADLFKFVCDTLAQMRACTVCLAIERRVGAPVCEDQHGDALCAVPPRLLRQFISAQETGGERRRTADWQCVEQTARERSRTVRAQQELCVSLTKADERDTVTFDVRLAQEMRERALRLPDPVERHAARRINDEDVERARAPSELFEAQIIFCDRQSMRARHWPRVSARGHAQRRIEREP